MTLDKFGRHISKRFKINDIDIKDVVNEVTNNVSLKMLDYKKNTLDIGLNMNVNINKISREIKSLEEFVKNENNLLKDNIEKINQVMRTKITDDVFLNAKEIIKQFREDIEELNTAKAEIAFREYEFYEITISDPSIVIVIHSLIDSIIKKLTEEVNKIDAGMGEVDTILNPTSLKILKTKLKDALDDMRKNIDKIKKYLKEKDSTILTSNLKDWNNVYKSGWDNYYINE